MRNPTDPMNRSQESRSEASLLGRVAIVTGGAGVGYGKQAVEALAEAGATVVLTSRCLEHATSAASAYRAAGLDVEGAVLDLRNLDSIRHLADWVWQRHGRLDILVNNAAANLLKPLAEVSIEEWNSVLAVNVTGTMLMSRSAAAALRESPGGCIVNIASIYGIVSPDPRLYGSSGLNSPLVYAVSKAAIVQMTRYLAVHWAPGIRVNCVSPGGLFNGQVPSFVEAYNARTPLGRMAGTEDLKGAILFLASDGAAYVTGQNLPVDGGWTIW